MSAAAWDARWNLRAPASSSAMSSPPTSSYASWKRRVQALLEAESVWEVVSEGVVFDEAWPLPKQLEFIQKDKLGMHLILSTVHDSVVALLQDGGADECNRSWLMLKRLEAVFAAHRMKAVRFARREFLDLNFVDFVRANYGGGSGNGKANATGGGVDEESDAMQRFIDKVQEKGDALFRLRSQQPALLLLDDPNSYCEDEKMYQLLDALPASWANFIAQECERQGDLTWASVRRKVLQEHSKRRVERLRKRLLQQGGTSVAGGAITVATPTAGSTATSVASIVSSSSNSRSKTSGANSSNNTTEQDQDDHGSDSAGGYPTLAYQRLDSANAFSSPVLTAKAEPPSSDQNQQQQQRLDDQYDLRSPADEEVMVYDFVGHQPSDSYPQQQQPPMPPYQSQQQPQDQYYDHSSRPKYGNRNNNSSSSLSNPRNRRDRDNNSSSGGGGGQRTPYSRPPNQNANANKICFYCSLPGHTAHHCPLKRMHMEERKKNNSGHQ